jgi:phycobilisome core-membrane linker protein
MQPIVLRKLTPRRPLESRPSLNSYNQGVAVWKALAGTQYAIEKAQDMSKPALRSNNVGAVPGGLQGKRAGGQSQPGQVYRLSPQQPKAEKEAVIQAVYRQVLERPLFDGFRLNEPESRVTNGDITIREFVRAVATSNVYIRQFLTRFPNTKVVEYLFKHLLGRVPQDQVELIAYHDLLARKGLKAAVEAMISSTEYTQVFGDDTVPYPRYTSDPKNGYTAGAYAGSIRVFSQQTFQNSTVNFPSFENPLLGLARYQGLDTTGNRVQPARPQLDAPRIYSLGDNTKVELLLRAAYKQVWEKDLGEAPRLSEPESRLRNGDITVKEFIRALGHSDFYLRTYLGKWDNSKLAEFNFKHFLGRRPASTQELAQHTQTLGQRGLKAAIDELLNGAEYQKNFGDNTVPYSTLRAERYVGTVDQPSRAYAGTFSQVREQYHKNTTPAYGNL